MNVARPSESDFVEIFRLPMVNVTDSLGRKPLTSSATSLPCRADPAMARIDPLPGTRDVGGAVVVVSPAADRERGTFVVDAPRVVVAGEAAAGRIEAGAEVGGGAVGAGVVGLDGGTMNGAAVTTGVDSTPTLVPGVSPTLSPTTANPTPLTSATESADRLWRRESNLSGEFCDTDFVILIRCRQRHQHRRSNKNCRYV